MKTIEQTRCEDEVIAEIRRHKEEIAAEHGYDIGALLRSLRARQEGDVRFVKSGRDSESGEEADRDDS